MNLSSITSVVLAGGFGTRIKHRLGSVPKPLAVVANQPFLHWIFHNLQNQGVRKIVLLTHYEADQIHKFAASRTNQDFQIKCIREETPAGTGGAVLNLIDHENELSEIFMLLNGDSLLLNVDLTKALEIINRGGDGVVIGIDVADTSRYGSLIYNNAGELLSFREKQSGSGTINSGIYCFRTKIFSDIKNLQLPTSLEKEIIPNFLDLNKKIYVLPTKGDFIDIGTDESLLSASSFVESNFLKI